MLLIKANESTAAKRRVYFHLVDATDGITPETGEASGQPQISSDGAAWTNTGIGTLTSVGNGRYYAELTQAAVQNAGTRIETRFKSANTAECPGDSVLVVAFDPHDAVRLGITALPNAAADAAGGLPISDAGGLDLDARLDAAITTRAAASTAVSNADLTPTRAGYLDRLDAAVSSRSTLTAQAVWEYATRSLSTYGTLVADVAAAVWAAGSRTLTAISDSSGITTLLSRIVGTLAAGTHQPQSGDAYARLGAPAGASIAADVATAISAANSAGTNAFAAEEAAAAAKAVTDKLDTALEADGGVYRFTANALEQAPTGEGGGATAGEIADAVWDEALAGHATAGSTGAALAAAQSAGDPWATEIPGAYAAGSAGQILGDNVEAIRAKTDTIGAATATYTTPMTPTGDAIIYAGQSHTGALALAWTIANWSGPLLTGNTARLRICRAGYRSPNDRKADVEFAATVTHDGTTVSAAVSLTDAQTSTLAEGQYRAQIIATVAGEDTIVRDFALTVRKALDAPAS